MLSACALLFVTGVLAFSAVGNAYGGAAYFILGHQGSPVFSSAFRYWGVTSSILCQSTGSVSAIKVNSIYEYYDSDDYYETGLVREPGWSYWRKFTAYERPPYTSGQVKGFFGDASQGSTYYFEINNRLMDGSPPVSWRANVGGTYFDRDLNFYKANPLLSAERYSTAVNNDAKYTNMKFRDYDGSWLNWSARPYWTRSIPEIYYYGYYSNGYVQFESKPY